MIILNENKEVKLNVGAFFGERALLFKSRRLAEAKAISFCILLTLHRNKLVRLYEIFEDLEENFKEGLSMRFLHKDATIKSLRQYPIFRNRDKSYLEIVLTLM